MVKELLFSQIVPDSEGEEDISVDDLMSGHISIVSSIQPPTTSMERPIPQISQISTFTEASNISVPSIAILAGSSGSSSSSAQMQTMTGVPAGLLRGPYAPTEQLSAGSGKPKLKPRPRPRTKPADKPPATGDYGADSLHIGSNVPPAPRGEPSGAPPLDPALPSSSIPGLSFANDAAREIPQVLANHMYGQGVAERAKLRARAASTKKKGKDEEIAPSPAPQDVVELSSDDEISFLSHKKADGIDQEASPKETKTKNASRRKADADWEMDGAEQNSTPIIIPIATSQPEIIDAHEVLLRSSEQSTPPVPATRSSKQTNSLHLQKSAPSSSPVPASSRKRRRISTAPSADRVQDDDDLELERVAPPPFFADSSSLPPSTVPQHTPSPSQPESEKTRANISPVLKKVPAKKNRKRNVIDSDDDGSDWAQSSSKRSGPQACKRKAVDDDEDDEESSWAADCSPDRNRAKPNGKVKKQIPARSKKKGRMAKQVIVEVNLPRRTRRSTASVSPQKSKESAVTSIRERTGLDSGPADSGLGSSENRKELVLEEGKPSQLAEANETSSRTSRRAKTGKSARSNAKRQEPLSDHETIVERPSSLQNKPVSASSGKAGKRAALLSDDEAGEGPSEQKECNGDDGRRDEKGAAVTGTKSTRPDTPQNKRGPSSSALCASSTSDRQHRIPRRDSRSMDEIIRNANAQPGSPFPANRSTYSPLVKMSRSALRNVVPLHPNRKTPPPPPPRPPPPKKSKKMLELEEKWEMELEESVDGWYCLSEQERAQLRRAKRDAELGYED